jgi:hypothetical protein
VGGLASVPHYRRIVPGSPLPEIKSLAPFKAIVVLEANYTIEWQNDVSDWLVAEGCRYMMAWGPNCSSWDDTVDWSVIEAAGGEPDDAKFVMTTWHEDEPLASVFWFAQFCANFSYDEVELINAVILHISHDEREKELLNLFTQAESLADREATET